MVSFSSFLKLPVRQPPQPPAKALGKVQPAQAISRPSGEAVTEIAKKPLSLPTKVAIGGGVLGSCCEKLVAVLWSGALGSCCEKLVGANNCQFITAPEAAISKLTGLPAQLAEGVVYVVAAAFVAGTTYVAYQMVDAPRLPGLATMGTFTVSTFIAMGIVNRED